MAIAFIAMLVFLGACNIIDKFFRKYNTYNYALRSLNNEYNMP